MLFPWPKCIERLLEEPDYETCETRRWMAKFHWSVCGPFRVQRRTSLVPSPTRPQGVRKNLVCDLRLRRTPSKKTRPSNWRYRDLDRCIACLTAGLWVYILKVRFIVYSLLQEVMHCTNWISQARTFFAQTVWLACTDLEGFWPFFFACVCVISSLASHTLRRERSRCNYPRNAIIEHSNKMLISSFCRRGNLMVAAWPDPSSLCEGCGLRDYMISPWTFCQCVKFYLLNLCTSILKVSKYG